MNNDFLLLASEMRNESLLQTEADFAREKDALFAGFADHFRVTLERLREAQRQGGSGLVSYIEYTMLYTNFINRRYVSEVIAYGESSYLDEKQLFLGEYGVSPVFKRFDELWDRLLAARKRFPGKVPGADVTAFMIESMPLFYQYAVNIARFGIKRMGRGLFEGVGKNGVLAVNVGDYMAATETVYTEGGEKDPAKLADWFSERLEDGYIFGDYSGVDLSGMDLSGMDFRYARFDGSVLRNTDFSNSNLIGADFTGAVMEGCRLDGCAIHEADFTGADLRGASFMDVLGKAGLPRPDKWEFVGFLPVMFKDADLKGANFTGADITPL